MAHSAVEAIATETVHLNRNCDYDGPFASVGEAEFEADLGRTIMLLCVG